MGVDTPNVTLPLASSYNERGVAGFTNTVTNGIDQRKINSFYEVVRNAISGTATLYLAKRPGITISANTYGTTGQVAYLVTRKIITNSNKVWVISKNGSDIRASDEAGTTVIVTAASYLPAYIDRTLISNTEYVVVQTILDINTAQRVFYSSTIGTWVEITDSDFTALVHRGKIEHMDGYAFVLDNMNRIFNSDLNSLANWSADSFILKQIKQDFSRGLAKLGNQIIAFGDETMEIFTNAGNPSGSPLQVQKSMFKRYGLALPSTGHYTATLGGRLYFCGREGGGLFSTGVYSYDGQSVEKVSSNNVDKIISQEAGAIYSVNTLGFNGKAGIAFALDPVTATPQRWLIFFPQLNEWFEWNSTVFSPINTIDAHLGVGSNQHRVYTFFNTDTWQDNSVDYTMTHQFKMPNKGNNRNVMSMFGVKGDTARSASTLNVEFSDDDWQSFQPARPIDMTQARKQFYRCGSYSDRGVRLTHTGNVECRLELALARVN